jgi:cardiolipin synthase
MLGVGFPWLPTSWRVAAILAAGVSDLADGASSRQLHVTSQTGRILDPAADKVFALGVVITLVAEGSLELWEVALVGLRDLMVLAGAVWYLVRRDWAAFRAMTPTFWGKATTAAQFLFILIFLIRQERTVVVFLLTATVSAVAAAQYLWIQLNRTSPEQRGYGL